MGRFLRDEQLNNLTVNEDLILELIKDLNQRKQSAPQSSSADEADSQLISIYTIRFDQKGYRAHDVNELINYFNQADSVERLCLQIESPDSLSTQRAIGSYVDIRFDKFQLSFLTVTSDDESWVTNAFSTIRGIIGRHRNTNGFFRNMWVELLIQLCGVLFGFVLSLWGASLISPHLSIENAFIISFFLMLLLFSNLWAHIGTLLKSLLNSTFPNIKFHRQGKDRLHWLYQTIIGGIVVAIALYMFSHITNFAGEILSGFIGI